VAEVKKNGYEPGQAFSERSLTVQEPSIHVYGDTATVRANGQAVHTKGRETQLYRKEQGHWRIVQVHYSADPSSRK
jgi:ketosteroid isomerase-like protein